MKRIPIFLALLFSAGYLKAQKTIVHDANAVVRDVKGFHGVEVGDAIDLYLTQSDNEAVAVSAKDPEWRDRIHTEVKNGILRIWLDARDSWHKLNGDKKLRAYVAFASIDRLSASGASDVFVDGVISGNSLTLRLSGASDFKGAIKVSELHFDQSGASDAQVTGSVSGYASIESSGASKFKGYDLAIEKCDANASGASDIRIKVNRELNAEASGASSIYYKGDGTIGRLHSSGASNVSRKA